MVYDDCTSNNQDMIKKILSLLLWFTLYTGTLYWASLGAMYWS